MSLKRRPDIRELSAILDPHILRKSRIRKALSFNPFNPTNMDADQPYYCPYALTPEGSYMPHSPEYWETQGKVSNETDYRTVREYRAAAGIAVQKIEGFRGLTKSIDKLTKALPVGHRHTYKDGKEYLKASDKHWEEVLCPDTPESGDHIERHAEKCEKIRGHITKKKDEGKLARRARNEVLRNVRAVLSRLFDGPLPEEIKSKFDLRRNSDK